MEISQLAMTSTLNTSELHRMNSWQWKSHPANSVLEANGQFCNILTPLQPLGNPPSCTTALYAKNTASISARCSLQIRTNLDISIPSQIAPNVWILTTAPSAITATITLICPGETAKFIKVNKPTHVL